jgi:hypothetical protein
MNRIAQLVGSAGWERKRDEGRIFARFRTREVGHCANLDEGAGVVGPLADNLYRRAFSGASAGIIETVEKHRSRSE